MQKDKIIETVAVFEVIIWFAIKFDKIKNNTKNIDIVGLVIALKNDFLYKSNIFIF